MNSEENTISELMGIDVQESADFRLEIGGTEELTPALIDAMTDLCHRVEDAAGPVVAVLRLGGGAERTGPGEFGIHLVNKWERALNRLERLDVTTVAVVDGACTGPAVEALLACDHRIGADEARLSMPSVGGELWPGMAIHRIAQQCGVGRARRMVLFGHEASAWEAVEIGLLDEVSSAVEEALAAHVARARDASGAGLAVRRRLLSEAATTGFGDALGTHLAACDRTLRQVHGEEVKAG
ncbi:enoyl-CoA-hydratase DpgB [Nocardiopsis listeri]|uniref:enoyl-CoA-hydratase DpgB n=1 Tax=Nocardiopsis listeri TaxID=53440 RepID=UPI000AA18540|nr:enoyl-CoA-hydratase DpgB [Nocardiopsis listeri]